MEKLLHYLSSNIPYCKCYKSYKYCLDNDNIPNSYYDDHENITVRDIGESVKYNSYISLISKMNQLKKFKSVPLFKYFLDGSRRTYKVDDIALNNRIYPVISGQIGVGCCERSSCDCFKKAVFKSSLVIAIPECADANSKGRVFYNNLLDKINDSEILKNRNLKFDTILSYKDTKTVGDEKYENRGIARIQDEMIMHEKLVVKNLAVNNQLNYDSYLLKDGSLEYPKMGLHDNPELKLSMIKSNYQHVVGVSKSFNPELCVDNRKRSNATKIADLPLYHRTPVFMYESGTTDDVKFAIWYIRKREVKRTISPFDGILKIEKILVSDKEQGNGLDSDEVDLISANICNERNPVAYGSDKRWANHLYPVYLTESFIKSKYLSDIFFLNLF